MVLLPCARLVQCLIYCTWKGSSVANMHPSSSPQVEATSFRLYRWHPVIVSEYNMFLKQPFVLCKCHLKQKTGRTAIKFRMRQGFLRAEIARPEINFVEL